MIDAAGTVAAFPRSLSAYPVVSGGLTDTLIARVHAEPFNAVATAIFLLAILHTFAAVLFAALARRVRGATTRRLASGRPAAECSSRDCSHFSAKWRFFGLWAVVLAVAHHRICRVGDGAALLERHGQLHRGAVRRGHHGAGVDAADRDLCRVRHAAAGSIGSGTPAAWWVTILTVGPLLGSFITEPGAMTISALLLARQFYDLHPGTRLKYATLGVLFVNVSIGGTLTHFAAPPLLMVASRGAGIRRSC